MKKSTLLIAICFLMASLGNAQDKEVQKVGEFEFTIINKAPVTSVKSQDRTGTCWCFGTTSMIESELIRLGKGEFDLSEMFTVRNCYTEKADKYVRFHGSMNFGPGGAQHDVINTIKRYGMVPNEVYDGLEIGEEVHMHGEMHAVLNGIVEKVIQNRNRKLSPVWKEGFEGVLDSYLGEYPEKFTYKGKEYTPRTFADELGINPDDYIEFSSYTHHPFYEKFVLEVADNWEFQSMYNVPIDELMEIMEYSLSNGISISWAADISGLNFKNGVALVPAEAGNKEVKPVEEKSISQEDRQKMYDSYQLTDDHCMHLTGFAKDQNGTKYYIEKNSWGASNELKGYSFMSESFMRLRTMSILVHKDAVPAHILNKLKK